METGRFSVNWIKGSFCKFSVIFVLDKPGPASRGKNISEKNPRRSVSPLKTARAAPGAMHPNIFLTRNFPQRRQFAEGKFPAATQA